MKKSPFNIALLTAVIAGSLVAVPVASRAETAPHSQARFGVNLAGAEFGGHILPGVYGTQYIYPSPETLDYYQKKGRTLIRLPFHWERMQRALNAPLDADELPRLIAV